MRNNKINFIAYTGIFAAVYVLMTLINPLGYGAMQFRISEVLCMAPLFNKKIKYPIYLGVFIANMFSPLGLIDVVVGMLIAVLSYEFFFKLKLNYLIQGIIYSLLCGVFVGAELFYVFKSPFIFNFLSIGTSQLIIILIAYPILKTLQIRKLI